MIQRTAYGFPAMLLLAACAIGPKPPETTIEPPAAYRTIPEREAANILWWEGFGDATLNTTVDQALRRNLTIAAADARLRRAAALAGASRSDLLPITDGTGSLTLRQGQLPQENAGLVGSWSPDIFGQQRRRLAATKANARSEAALLDDARRLIVGALVSTYIELRRTDAQRALLEQSLDLQRQTLRIVRLRADAGLAADLDVQRATGDLARTRAQAGPLFAARQRAENALSVLIRAAPGTATFSARDPAKIPAYAAGPSVGVPADLLRQRPDIRAAEQQLIAASNLVGVEMADLLPSLNLSGFLSADLQSADIAFETVRRATATLDVPLLDAGRRWAEVRAARAATDEALRNYEASLLIGLGEVENALASISAAERRRDDLRDAVAASEVAFEQLQALYTEGLATLIDVLDAQRQLIGSREGFTNSEAEVASAYVALYQALGAPTIIEAHGDVAADASSDPAG